MKQSDIKILYVEDDINLSSVVTDFLQMQSYAVYHYTNAEDVIKNWDGFSYDICLLDIMLPGMDGFGLSRFIKQQNENMPIIFLSAKDQINDKIQGLKIGADDYITKPFSTIELDLRIQAIIKRVQASGLSSEDKNAIIKIGDFRYIENDLKLIYNDEVFKLTKKENQLINYFFRNPNQLIKREELLKLIWGKIDHNNSRSMDVYINKVRKILSCDPKINIVNYHGTGFKLEISQ
jgi:DNA-binding response OmpR family regulator